MRSPLLVAAVVLSAGTLVAQVPEPVVVPDEPSCATCEISVRRLATLGTDTGPGALAALPLSMTADGLGRYWVFPELEPPIVFSAGGAAVRVGRIGSGPGEFRSPSPAVAIGDSMLVLDDQLSRATVVGPDLTAVRSIVMPVYLVGPVVVKWPSLIVMSGWAAAAYPPNSALHRVSFDGPQEHVLGSFGPRGSGGAFGLQKARQLTGAARDGHIWSSDWQRLRFTLWNSDGTAVKSFQRKPEWFPDVDSPGMGTPAKPPDAMVRAIRGDSSGLVWVVSSLPAPTWKEGWPKLQPGQREVLMKDMSFDKFFRSMVEVIDPNTARVVARRQFDSFVYALLPGNRAAIYRVDDDGFPRIDVVALSVTGR